MTKRKAINVPVNEEQEKKIKEKAKSKGMTVSAYLRYLAIYADDRKEV